jgi:hypothetical protein
MSQQSSHLCTHCNQPHIVKLAHKETMNKQKLTMLKAAASRIIETGVNDFRLAELDGDANQYTNFQKLRYHGLIHHARDAAGNRKKGHWLITRNGWAFLRGELDIPKYVLVKDNHIESRADTTLSIRDVYYGSEAIHTTFEYFDDAGRMVGVHPIYPKAKPQQASLGL